MIGRTFEEVDALQLVSEELGMRNYDGKLMINKLLSGILLDKVNLISCLTATAKVSLELKIEPV